VDIPLPAEIQGILAKSAGWQRACLLVAVFAGLRSSELRGLMWADVDFSRCRLNICRRADHYRVVGSPKSETSRRAVPVPALVTNALKAWKLECPPGDLVFPHPTTKGIFVPSNLAKHVLHPPQKAAGLVVDGKPKYPGMHALRHFYASWLINRPEEGGQGLPPKIVQERLGHSTIAMTMDVYGHLFPAADDREALDAAALRLISGNAT
jgi:integrase